MMISLSNGDDNPQDMLLYLQQYLPHKIFIKQF